MSEQRSAAIKGPPFLMWYDDNPKLSVSIKIQAAIAAYCQRFGGVKPSLVLVNEAELTEVTGIQVRGVSTVSRNTYWVGQNITPVVTTTDAEQASA